MYKGRWRLFFLLLHCLSGLCHLEEPLDLSREQLPKGRFIILFLHALGLANRLRVLASAVQLAEEAQRTLYVSWKATKSCNATYFELFGSSGSRDFKLYASQGVERVVVHPQLMKEVLHLKWKGNIQQLDAVKVSQRVVLLQTTAFFQLRHVTCQEYLRRKQHFYQSLMLHKPIPMVSQIFEKMFEQHLRKRLVVGVHIRIDDPAHDWRIVPPHVGHDDDGGKKNTGFLSWGEVSPPSSFIEIMRGIKKHHPRVLFFLASNSVAARKQVAAAFPASDVVTIEVDGTMREADQRSTVFGIRKALLDWLILAHTSLIVHAYRSSFGEEAAQLHLVPSIQVRKGGHVFGPDLNSRHCNQHVISAKDSERECVQPPLDTEQYADGTGTGEFNRQQAYIDSICPRKVVIREDKRIKAAWGVAGVYAEVDSLDGTG
jgi:hypothetical protein